MTEISGNVDNNLRYGNFNYSFIHLQIRQYLGGELNNERNSATHFFGLFDGHAGGRCSKHISTNLPDVLAEDSLFQSNLPFALKKSYHTANDAFLKIAELQKLHDGSTGITSLIRNNKLLVGNVGDCRALLLSNGKSIQMSIDQKPTNPEEMKRIASLGGIITNNLGVARVNGVLAVSRAFGNRKLRKVIRPDIEMMQRELTKDDDFLIMASDGLWDVLRNRDVCDICYSLASSSTNQVQQIADQLVSSALSKGSMDNVTCIVVKLTGYVMKLNSGENMGGENSFSNSTIGTSMERNSRSQGARCVTSTIPQTHSTPPPFYSSIINCNEGSTENVQGQAAVLVQSKQQMQRSTQQQTIQQHQSQQVLFHHQQQQQQQHQQQQQQQLQPSVQRSLFPRGASSQIPLRDYESTDNGRHNHHHHHPNKSSLECISSDSSDSNNDQHMIANGRSKLSNINKSNSNMHILGSNNQTLVTMGSPNLSPSRSEPPINISMNSIVKSNNSNSSNDNNNNDINHNINGNHHTSKSNQIGLARTNYGSMGDLLKSQNETSKRGNIDNSGGNNNQLIRANPDFSGSNNNSNNNNYNNNIVTRPWSVSSVRAQMADEIQTKNLIPTSVTTSVPLSMTSAQQIRQIPTPQQSQPQPQSQALQRPSYNEIIQQPSQLHQNSGQTHHQNQNQNHNYAVEINRPGFGPIYKQNHIHGRGKVSKDFETLNSNIDMQNALPAKGFSKSLPITITSTSTSQPYYDSKGNGYFIIKESHESDRGPIQGSGIVQRTVTGSRAVSASAASVRHRQNQSQNINTSVNNALPRMMSKAISTDSLNALHHNRESKDSPFFSPPEMKFTNVPTAGFGPNGAVGSRPLHSPIAFLGGGGGGGGVSTSSGVGTERQRSASVTARNGGGGNRQMLGQVQGQVQTLDNHNMIYASALSGEKHRVPTIASDRKFIQMRIAHV